MENSLTIGDLNARYEGLTYYDRIKLIFDEFAAEEILVTTSFGSTSVALLHMINKVQPGHPIYLIDTGYLFEETHQYKEMLVDEYGLNLQEVSPNKKSHQFTQDHKVWKSDPDFCCFVNKVEPLKTIKQGKQVWVSGLLKYQNANRSEKNIFELQDNLLKFYPILDMSREDMSLYRTIFELPAHPLQYKGYQSIGCVQCTKKGKDREGRWQGTAKTECGLHS